MSVNYGYQKTCNICGKVVFSLETGDKMQETLAGPQLVMQYDGVDKDWVEVNDTIDVCPECINKMRKLFKKEEEDA